MILVATAAKILTRMRQNPSDWRMEDLQVVADSLGITYRQPGTSHFTFRTPRATMLTVPARRPIKPVYVRKFLALVDELE